MKKITAPTNVTNFIGTEHPAAGGVRVWLVNGVGYTDHLGRVDVRDVQAGAV